MDALLIKADGTSRKVSPKNGTDFKLRELYKLLNCERIEVIYPYEYEKTGMILICDEESKLNNRPANKVATITMCKGSGKIYDFIAGDVIYCPTEMLK